jgi:hypothetical protein
MSRATPPPKADPVGPVQEEELEPGPSTRRQRRLAGQELPDDIGLPITKRRPAAKRPQSLPVLKERWIVEENEDDGEVFNPKTPRLSTENLVPLLSSTLRSPSTAGPSTGRSDKTFNFTGASGSKEPGLWLTKHQANRKESSVDSFQAAVDAAHLEVSYLDSEGSELDEDFQEAVDQPLPLPDEDEARDPPEQASNPSEQASNPSEQASNPSEQASNPSEQASNPSEAERQVIDVEIVAAAATMEAAILEHRQSILECMEIEQEDYAPLRMERVEYDFLKKRVDEADEWKIKMRKAAMYLSTHDADFYNRELLGRVTNLRKKLSDFVIKGQENLAQLAVARVNAPRNLTEAAQATAREIKAKSVTDYSDTTVTNLKALAIKVADLQKIITPELDQARFRKEEENERAYTKQVEAVLKDAHKLRSDAVDAGLAEQAADLDKEARALQKAHSEMTAVALAERLSRNLATTSGSAGIRASDLSPPTFSGDNSINADYFKFSKDLDQYIAVKCPSNEELLRVLLTKCLKLEAQTACK